MADDVEALGELVGMSVVMLDSVVEAHVDGVMDAVDNGVVEAHVDGVAETVWELAVDGVGIKLGSLDDEALGVPMLVCVSDNVVIIDTL